MSSEKQRTAWEKQLLVREKNRPTIHDYLPRIFEEFFELHGDRGYGDDGAILGGIARLNGVPVTIIAEVKGRNLEENKRSNFAMPHPADEVWNLVTAMSSFFRAPYMRACCSTVSCWKFLGFLP